MKHFLGLLVVAAVVGFAFMHEDENGESFYDRMMSEDGAIGKIQVAEETTVDYAGATQRRIDAEFEN